MGGRLYRDTAHPSPFDLSRTREAEISNFLETDELFCVDLGEGSHTLTNHGIKAHTLRILTLDHIIAFFRRETHAF